MLVVLKQGVTGPDHALHQHEDLVSWPAGYYYVCALVSRVNPRRAGGF